MDEKRGENRRVPLSQVAVAATVARAQRQQARATRRRSSSSRRSSNTETRACARAHQTQLHCDARVSIGTHGTSLRWLKLDQLRLKRAARAQRK